MVTERTTRSPLPAGAKPISSLTAEDLLETPVWSYHRTPAGPDDPPDSVVDLSAGAETEWVAPTTRTALSEDDEAVYLAVTLFTLASGHEQVGFCSPTDDSGIDYVQPVIITADGLVRLYHDGAVTEEQLARELARLPAGGAGAFPIRYRCLVACDGRFAGGEVDEVTATIRPRR
jgi:hypothetical protein